MMSLVEWKKYATTNLFALFFCDILYHTLVDTKEFLENKENSHFNLIFILVHVVLKKGNDKSDLV